MAADVVPSYSVSSCASAYCMTLLALHAMLELAYTIVWA